MKFKKWFIDGKIYGAEKELNECTDPVYSINGDMSAYELLIGAIKNCNAFYDAMFYNSFESDEYATEEFLKIFKVKSDIKFHCHEKSNWDLNFNIGTTII